MTAAFSIEHARSFLSGAHITFDDADFLWRSLKKIGELSLARRVLERLRVCVRNRNGLLGSIHSEFETRSKLCQQEAELTSKDPELSSSFRHDRALDILKVEFDLASERLDGDAETLGIAAGILKRRWMDLGQIKDLRNAADFYRRGAGATLGLDAYAHINAAFLDDMLADLGDDPDARRSRARELRERIVNELPSNETVPESAKWFNAASRAEALLGLRRYDEATNTLNACPSKPAPWELRTTAQQLAALAYLREERPLDLPAIRRFFDALLPGSAEAVASAMVGKVGLALSGGGFRASFYHLGVLARLAELDVLRNVEVLSCVSGGSIVGACYWLALRKRLLQPEPFVRGDYTTLINGVIEHFLKAVATNLRARVQPNMVNVALRFLKGQKGALDPEYTAKELGTYFYEPLVEGSRPVYLHELSFTPTDHDPALAGAGEFNPSRHNWLRAHKVPILVINATTVNTGHAWQFTPKWMGESPWAIHESADSIPRLEWSWYEPNSGWKMELGRAVAASACVPFVFSPMRLTPPPYIGVEVDLVDGGVHDNQGTVALLAQSCNVVLVSDACGQLLLEKQATTGLKDTLTYAKRSMDTLMERVRLANFGDLVSRQRTGLLRGLMFLHMKAGLDANPIRPHFSQESYTVEREILSPSGIRKDFQQALAELRTDLDAFTEDESNALMACGYQMAYCAFERDLAHLRGLSGKAVQVSWSFKPMLTELRSTAATTVRREELLDAFRAGSSVRINSNKTPN